MSASSASVTPVKGESSAGGPKSSFSEGSCGDVIAIGEDGRGTELAEFLS